MVPLGISTPAEIFSGARGEVVLIGISGLFGMHRTEADAGTQNNELKKGKPASLNFITAQLSYIKMNQ
ncbi:hypothetical protein NUKP32_55250 [Klebsiella variicola]|nr:hypothetical protein [Klebsiella variicola]GKJ62637.1 hypothetical protein NUKP32_55250 [Klebsiella variicola]